MPQGIWGSSGVVNHVTIAHPLYATPTEVEDQPRQLRNTRRNPQNEESEHNVGFPQGLPLPWVLALALAQGDTQPAQPACCQFAFAA